MLSGGVLGATIPITLPLSVKVTLPASGAPLLETTLAEISSFCRKKTVGRETNKVVVVVAWLTFCVNTGEVGLAMKLESPPYTAVMECAPGSSADVLIVAFLLGWTAPVPSDGEPSLHVLVTVGVHRPGAPMHVIL